ncbi:MAG: hypothetical protein FJ319_03145 [SAR202 cluster bacterium]|nr:hypothetical protein [SAR202 cluster bacterium]
MMKRFNPGNQGQSGMPPRQPGMPQRPPPPPPQPEGPQLVAVKCSVCQRKRNIPKSEAQKAGENYVCMTCIEEGRVPKK